MGLDVLDLIRRLPFLEEQNYPCSGASQLQIQVKVNKEAFAIAEETA